MWFSPIPSPLQSLQFQGLQLLMFRNSNVAAMIFERQLCTPRGTNVHYARKFYENLVPSCTIYDVECPDNSFRKFTDDGQYLISFSRNHQDLIVYRPKWFSYSCKGEDCDLPSRAKRFDSFFTELYSVTLANSNELICKDFFLYVESTRFGLFATSTAQLHEMPATGGAIQGVPSIERITFHLLRLEDGTVLDEKVFLNDFINLAHNVGVFLYDDLLAIVSLRYQTIHILQIRESGDLVDVRAIGAYCREDDELFLNSNTQDSQPNTESFFLSGIKQRLLSFIFRGIWDEERNNSMRVQGLKKKFYFHFQDYVDLIFWKVQFLDRHHLLIKFGSVEGGVRPCFLTIYDASIGTKEFLRNLAHLSNFLGAIINKKYVLRHFSEISNKFNEKQNHKSSCVRKDTYENELPFAHENNYIEVSRSAENHPSFFAVYNMDTTEIIAFYVNTSDELYQLFEQFCDHFYVSSSNSLYMNFISSHSNNIHALEQLLSIKVKASNSSQFVKKMLSSLPFSCQSLSPSPYFDQSLFRFDEKLISATDRHRPSTDHPIKFISRRQPFTLKFKIKPGPEAGSADSRNKKVSSFLFHPFLPLVLSIQQTMFLQPTLNIHFR